MPAASAVGAGCASRTAAPVHAPGSWPPGMASAASAGRAGSPRTRHLEHAETPAAARGASPTRTAMGGSQGMSTEHGMMLESRSPGAVMSRHGSGTSWQPDDSPMFHLMLKRRHGEMEHGG